MSRAVPLGLGRVCSADAARGESTEQEELMIETQEQAIGVQHARTGIVDCDVHPMPRGSDEIKTYLPMPWRDRYGGGGRGFFGNVGKAADVRASKD